MFNPNAYGEEVAAILALEGNGERLMPLVHAKCSSPEARARIERAQIAPALRAGLYLYFDCWDEAHTVAQDLNTPEGSYWHAIVHRQEPDPGNAGYWFRQVGTHPIFETLHARAAQIGISVVGVATGARWNPTAFIDYCGNARPGSPEERKAQELQRAEWQLLFDWCAR
jgi:hypothetical protein